ncbi:hypothetical protein GV792_12040 [Nocardia cyriacigeorgica]|uniref:hypothetical protein n=1 Tax=Nocardia cyriacigeorgica TaxID=135487 RepID=UPI0013BC86A9|nr:hypothetical protein [Nocardia cyriacigeorgica]NEW50790.1 hypothetical protein [Nocardia cyriacigeorgica]
MQEALAAIDMLSPGYRGLLRAKLPEAIAVALRPPAPDGSPTKISKRADGYVKSGKLCDESAFDLSRVATRSLPSVWRGDAAETAAQVVRALSAQSEAAKIAFGGAGAALTDFSEKLTLVQRTDTRGVALLRQAAKAIRENGADAEVRALQMAADGCHQRLKAAQIRDGAAEDAASALKECAALARAGRVKAPGISPASSVVLAYTGDFGFTADPLGDLLTPIALERGSQLLNKLSASDRAAFDKMLADAHTPQEAAYLWNALAAGHSFADVQAFGRLIHPHGKDLKWMYDHLDPHINSRNTGTGRGHERELTYRTRYFTRTYDGKGFGFERIYQQNKNNCVSASTLVARAANDPVFMLGLTTGEGPGAVGGATPGDDSQGALRNRLTTIYDATDAKHPGGKNGSELFTNQLGPAAGSGYHNNQGVDTPAERREYLPAIESAVNEGKPVPITVVKSDKDDPGAHEVIILAARDDKLEVYNPWGYTRWVTKQQFIDGEMGRVTGAAPNRGHDDPTSVALPQ